MMMDQYAETFREETIELLSELEVGLLELEQRPDDADVIGRVFRALHTVKGSAGMIGFDAISDFTHEVETVFELVRSGSVAVSAELVNLTLAARDMIKSLMDAEFGGQPIDPEAAEQIVAALRSLVPDTKEIAPPVEAGIEATEPEVVEETTYHIRFRPPANIFHRGIRPLALLQELARLGSCRIIAETDAVPDLDELDPELCYLYWDIILATVHDEDKIRDVFIFVEDDCDLKIFAINDDLLDAGGGELRLGDILIQHGDLTHEQLAQVMSSQSKPKLGESLVQAGVVSGAQLDVALEVQAQVKRQQQKRQAIDEASSIRVRSEKLDSLVNLVGELVTVQARLSQTADGQDSPVLSEIAEEVERLTWEMRDHILNIRMLPIGTTFSRYQRLVRDLSRELGKEVQLVTAGAETELDKTVIERLGDPLVHLIRNSIDHGLESPEERQAAGKNPKGTIFLSATHSGANVILEIRDDGGGINREAIRERARTQGLLTSEMETNDTELINLIFTPGFSTVGEVSSVSGRGVGMDVVKKAIDSLRGSINVSSKSGEGTTFTVKLPLTLAIIDGLLVQVAEEIFVLPLSAVEECIELSREDVASANNKNLIRVRGEIVPYLRLRERFDLDGELPDIEQVVVAEAQGQRVGFAVDHVIGEHQTVIKALGTMYKDVKGLSGATILGDGTVALILDLPPLVQEAELDERELTDSIQEKMISFQ
ncbi:MAG TPA: chemotaxis protein CheA [Geopsychrobacteraceae bacterium]|nr:chemotaxis protein CheA [Geopsychrobacteraceae bacterium]